MFEYYSRKLFSSRVSIVSLFTMFVIILTIPLLMVFSQKEQDVRERAAAPKVDLLPPHNSSGSISGYVYDDKNKDGQREPGEQGISDVQIKVTQINDTSIAPTGTSAKDIVSIITTDTNGYFKYPFSGVLTMTPTFSIKLMLPTGYRTIDTNPIVLTNVQREAKQILEFGLFRLSTPLGLVTPTCIPRPSCLSATPSCKIALPAGNWCPVSQTLPTGSSPVRKGD